jgi:hypothetical protein
VTGTHQPAGEADEDVRALSRWRLARDQPDGLAVLGLRILAAVLRPQAVADPRVEVPGQGRTLGLVDPFEGCAEPGDRLVAVARVVGHPRRPSPKLDRVRQVGVAAGVLRHARLEADGQAVLAAGGRVRVDGLCGLGASM